MKLSKIKVSSKIFSFLKFLFLILNTGLIILYYYIENESSNKKKFVTRNTVTHITFLPLEPLLRYSNVPYERWPKVNGIFSPDTFEKSIVESEPRVVSPMNNNRTNRMLKNGGRARNGPRSA